MTADELLTAAVIDTRAAYAEYETYSTDELRRLQIAHQLEAVDAVTPEAIAFGGGRLALIAAVLRKRGINDAQQSG